ncbi:glucose-6-phosphate isomerase [Actinokineospora globicatena]|uniref:glucose-6-phosphate isomerase n=1 Tax=Actinokineospora globicatena TaxID=103729 RepID=UPI0020A4E41F|nr:glucose-6-phosphate isomerase [Actinokineospora globicatena]MCP2304807.1 glucose-6-phosphate isomerase (EC 5.3.1.9) [Actinokineospora globicatena]GLW77817.1 glucose-6-phosphate isomerase [Actinokineospora globicatena]GLW85515.1 glucose-6-phosphate isomerase [Actinokineospora globicatena]
MAAHPGEVAISIVDERLAEEAAPLVRQLVEDRVASRLTAQDPTLWGPDAESEARVRLSWTSLATTSRPLLAEIDALRAELAAEGIDRVVLAGMGGSSLAPEVITATAGVPLVVLDTTDPGQVADALAGELARTVLVVSSKSGSTVETDSHRRVFTAALAEEGLDPARHIVVVTDPGSPLEKTSVEAGYRRVFQADPDVGGRYSALTAFGLVPAGLAGADIAGLLDDAEAAVPVLSGDSEDNPALVLAAALGAAHARGAEKVVLADTGSGIKGFGDWAEQLVAESTGKNGTGLLPVVVEGPQSPGFSNAGDDATAVSIGSPADGAKVGTTGSLGGLILLWEYATAVVGKLLAINPFDQPDVEAAKKAARALLDSSDAPQPSPAFVSGPVEVHPSEGLLPEGTDSLAGAVHALLASAPAAGYLSVQAYLDRLDDASAVLLRTLLARASGLQTTFGWGPRFLHSTGQYHKGGHQNGVFLQITGAVEQDLAVPERPYTLGGLQVAQALGDGQVLAGHGRPVLRLHFTDRAAGLARLVEALAEVGR